MKFAVFTLIFCVSICAAYEQFITFYDGLNFTGDSHTFKSKNEDISNVRGFILTSKSIRVRGYWSVFNGTGFTGASFGYGYSDTETQAYPEFAYTRSGSIRHGGLLETSQPSITLFSLYAAGGIEKIITAPASNDIPFFPYSILTTGFSNWTFFTGPELDGNATCYISTRENHYLPSLNSTLANIRSLVRGCIGRINTYLYAQDFNLQPTELDF